MSDSERYSNHEGTNFYLKEHLEALEKIQDRCWNFVDLAENFLWKYNDQIILFLYIFERVPTSKYSILQHKNNHFWDLKFRERKNLWKSTDLKSLILKNREDKFWNRFSEKLFFWTSCMIFRYYPQIHFNTHFWKQNALKKFLDTKKYHFWRSIFIN